MWGRRGKYDAEVTQLAFTKDDTALAHKLLDAMIARLDRRDGQITCTLSEKVSAAMIETWRILGFSGVPGANQLNRPISDAAA